MVLCFVVRYFTSVNTSFAIILMGKRKLDALIYNIQGEGKYISLSVYLYRLPLLSILLVLGNDTHLKNSFVFSHVTPTNRIHKYHMKFPVKLNSFSFGTESGRQTIN